MLLPRTVIWMLSLGVMVLDPGVVSGQATSTGSGQDYPNKPIRIVTGEPGANTDFVTRLIGQGLTPHLGQQVITENRPSGIIAAKVVFHASPDGYTLLLQSNSFWIGPFFQKTTYDPVRDFLPITLPTNGLFFLYVHPSVQAKSVRELITLAKAKPGELNYGSAGLGSTNHLATELFKTMAAVNIVRVPYKGAGPAAIGLITNQVQVMFGSAATGMSHAKAGRLRILAVASAQPSPLAPDVPTVAASGVPGYEATSMSGIWAPAKTPRKVISRLNREIVWVLNQADAKEKLLISGTETVGNSAEQAAIYIKSDMAKWGKLIKDAGIQVD